MPGCGQFTELDFLLLQEGTLPVDHPLKAHLNLCDACLEEVLELSRVSTAMDFFPMDECSILPVLSLRILNGLKTDYSAFGGFSGALTGAEIRSAEGGYMRGVRADYPELRLKLEVYVEEAGDFRLHAHSPLISGQSVELREVEQNRLVCGRRSDEPDFEAAGLSAGLYELKIAGHIIKIKLADERIAPNENY